MTMSRWIPSTHHLLILIMISPVVVVYCNEEGRHENKLQEGGTRAEVIAEAQRDTWSWVIAMDYQLRAVVYVLACMFR